MPLRKHPLLVAIVGPTGSGKSALALRVAQEFQGEIVNCDSVQIYRYFDIGAAKLSLPERRGIPHHLVDFVEPDAVFTAADYMREGRSLLSEIDARGRLPVVAGGTGFYLRALIDGLAPAPDRDPRLRESLAAREARHPGSIHRLLKRFDAPAAARIHANDLRKATRALEIRLRTRRSATEVFLEGRAPLQNFQVLKIGLFPAREALYRRLDARMEQMFAAGLIAETAAILARGFPETAKPFEAIGYKQALQSIHGELTPREALFYATRDTRRYAKRQMTWFRQEPGLEQVNGFGDDAEVQEIVLGRVRRFLLP